MSEVYKTSLPPVTVETAKGGAKTILENAVQHMGMVPNLYASLGNSPALIETYTTGYNQFRADSGFTPAEQEVVFLTISRENECNYCVGGHSFAGDFMSNVPTSVTDAIRDGKEVPDARLKALCDFTLVMMRKHGRPGPEDVAAFHNAGFSDTHMLSIILAIGIKTMSNYTNHLFRTELDSMMSSRAWKNTK